MIFQPHDKQLQPLVNSDCSTVITGKMWSKLSGHRQNMRPKCSHFWTGFHNQNIHYISNHTEKDLENTENNQIYMIRSPRL